ncbi:MAG TPA: hypothetical protein VJQ44_17615 [Gemmatimonadales bacterium]|nr:hypothetical protein [Gemmatimonadales bacterium]
MLEGFKARLDQLFRERGGGTADSRAVAAALREALVEGRAGIVSLREALAVSERELAAEQKQLADAERRGRLAAALPDQETVTVAERFAARHRERITLLERKLVVQRDELVLAEREVEEMTAQLRSGTATADSIRAAWRDLEAAGGSMPTDDERVAHEADRRRRDQAVEEQLAYLKRKLGKKD